MPPQPPQIAPRMTARLNSMVDATVMRRAVFTLYEGDVAIQFPAELSKESVEDLADYIDVHEAVAPEAKADEAAN